MTVFKKLTTRTFLVFIPFVFALALPMCGHAQEENDAIVENLKNILGSHTLAKNSVVLSAGQPVELVSLSNTCHYFGVTDVNNDGTFSIVLDRELCGNTEKKVTMANVDLRLPLRRGDTLWIPYGGVVKDPGISWSEIEYKYIYQNRAQ